MNKVNVALVRVLQFVVFLLFTFMVLVYFGTLILIPLDALMQLVSVLTLIGLPGIVSTLVAIPIVGYLGYMIFKIPGLSAALIETGFELAIVGQSRVQDFNEIVASLDYRSDAS